MRAAMMMLLALLWWGAADSTLRVKTDVTEVEVVLDGQPMGQTPATISPIAPGRHQLSLMKPGYEDNVQEVQIEAGATQKLFVVMTPSKQPLPALPAKFFVLHQHRAGACSGVLTVTAEALDFRSHDDKDVFHIPVQQIKSVSRSMGSVPSMYGTLSWRTPSELAGCRVEAPGRSYGFFAYEDNPDSPNLKAQDTVKFQDTKVKTKELFELVYRLWMAKNTAQKAAAAK
jgi:hypothetical protein